MYHLPTLLMMIQLFVAASVRVTALTLIQQQRRQQQEEQPHSTNDGDGTATESSGGCTLCADGSVPNLYASIGETSCQTIAEAITYTPANSSLCTMTQLQGYIHCYCPTYPTDTYCSMCPTTISATTTTTTDAQYYYTPIPKQNRNKIIPFLTVNTTTITTASNRTCGEVEFVERTTTITANSNELCSMIQQDSVTEYCGCVGVTKQTCNLCNNDDMDDDDDNTNNHTMMFSHRLLPPSFTTSCASLDRSLATVQSSKECATITKDDTLFNERFDSSSTTQLSLLSSVHDYCGCTDNGNGNGSSSNVSIPKLCQDGLCSSANGQGLLRNPNTAIMIPNSRSRTTNTMTCSDLDIAIKFIQNETYCEELRSITDYQLVCCTSTDSFTPPTVSPIENGNNNDTTTTIPTNRTTNPNLSDTTNDTTATTSDGCHSYFPSLLVWNVVALVISTIPPLLVWMFI